MYYLYQTTTGFGNATRIIAFQIIPNGGSQRISESNVLPGLAIALLEEGLRRSREMDNTSVAAWFLAQNL